MDISHRKRIARSIARQRRHRLFADVAERLNAEAGIHRALIAHIDRLPAQHIALYIGEHHEPRLSEAAQYLHRTGRTLCLPCSPSASQKNRPFFRRYAPEDSLTRTGKPAFMQPDIQQDVIHPDMIVCPVLAFDRKGRRLGQGGGYYDQAIDIYKPNHTIGVAFFGMQHETLLPTEHHDIRPDCIITERAII